MYLLMFVEAICSLLLIGVILIQRSKSQGLGVALGGQMGEALFGARMGNVLTRVTVILGIVFLVNTTLLAFIGATRTRTSVTDAMPETSPAASVPVPGEAASPDTPLSVEIPADATPIEAAPPMVAVEPGAPVELTTPPAATPPGPVEVTTPPAAKPDAAD